MYEIRRKRNGSGGGSSRRKSRYGISSGELGSRLRHLKRRAAAKQGGGENDGESEGMPALAMSRRRDYDRGADAFWDGSLTDRSETDSVPSLANRIGFSSVTPRFKHMRKVDTPSPGTYTPRLDYMYSKRSSLGSNRTFGSSTSRFAKKKLGQMAFPGKFKPRGHVGSSTSRKAAPSAFIAASDSDDDGYHEPGPGFYDLGEHKKRYKGGASSMFTSRTRRILYRKPQDVPDPAAYDVPPGGINSVPWHASDTWQGSSMFMSEVPKHIIANPHLDSGIGPGSYNHPKLTSVCVQAPFKNKRNRFAPMAAPTSTMTPGPGSHPMW